MDGEGAMASDEFGMWCQRRTIKRFLAGKDQHLKLVERHNGLIRRTMRILEAEASIHGLSLSLTELAYEACCGKNCTIEYGGYTAIQGLTGGTLGSREDAELFLRRTAR